MKSISYTALIMVIVAMTTATHARGKTAAKASTDADPQIVATVNQWMTAFQKKDVVALRAMGTTMLDEWSAIRTNEPQKNISLESALHSISEFRIENIATLVPGQMALADVQEIIEDEPVREWNAILTLTKSGGTWQVSHVLHVMIEYHMAGYPEGCPETVFTREQVASLDGKLSGNDPSLIRVYTLRRDTEPWGGGAREIDTEATKCQMKPETTVQDLEWMVTSWQGKILLAQQLGRTTSDGGGITLFDGGNNGSLTRGGVRLESIASGQPGIVFLSRKYEGGSTSTAPLVARVGAYQWKGNALKNIWNFDFKRKGAVFSVDLKSGDGGKNIVAAVQSGAEGVGCPEDSVIMWFWTGSGFKIKDKVKGGCTSSSWPGEGSILSRNGFKLPPLKAPNEAAN